LVSDRMRWVMGRPSWVIRWIVEQAIRVRGTGSFLLRERTAFLARGHLREGPTEAERAWLAGFCHRQKRRGSMRHPWERRLCLQKIPNRQLRSTGIAVPFLREGLCHRQSAEEQLLQTSFARASGRGGKTAVRNGQEYITQPDVHSDDVNHPLSASRSPAPR
jgi:hypothetical protein